jgi:diguanylate cyclase (GGDEF)-like protein
MPAAETLVVALALTAGAAAVVVSLRLRAQLAADRHAFAAAHARAAPVAGATRRLAAAGRRSVAEVRDEIVRAVHDLAPDVDSVLVFDERDGALLCTTAAGSRVAYFAGTQLARTDPSALPARALACGHRVTLPDSGTRGFHPADRFAIALPLVAGDGPASVLYAAATVPQDADVVEAIVALAEHAAYAGALAAEREADRQRAEYDALTGLLTPRAFRERLAGLVERARYAKLARLALAFVDTDHFKEWNDAYGHAAGDALLRALAHTLRAASGDGELVARNGGDEFCLVFVDTEKSQALARAEALRANIAALDLRALRPPGATAAVPITASIGVAALPADASTANELLERADAAMYHAKRSGRNAVAYAGVDGTLVRLETTTVPV